MIRRRVRHHLNSLSLGSLVWGLAMIAWVVFLLLVVSLQEEAEDSARLPQLPPAPLLALILSDARPESAARRTAIREGWCAPAVAAAANATCVFVLSATPYADAAEAALAEEQAQHNDLLRVDTGGMRDTWETLPAKVFAALRWAAARGRGEAVLKTDHDCFADIGGIARGVARLGGLYYWGSFYRDSWPKTSRADKYFDPLWVNKSAQYPLYAAGPGYVLSPVLVGVLAGWTAPLPSVLEDVCVGNAVHVLAPSTVVVHDPWRFVSQRAPVCVPGMLLKHCSMHLADITRFSTNLQLRGDPCRSAITLVDPL